MTLPGLFLQIGVDELSDALGEDLPLGLLLLFLLEVLLLDSVLLGLLLPLLGQLK